VFYLNSGGEGYADYLHERGSSSLLFHQTGWKPTYLVFPGELTWGDARISECFVRGSRSEGILWTLTEEPSDPSVDPRRVTLIELPNDPYFLPCHKCGKLCDQKSTEEAAHEASCHGHVEAAVVESTLPKRGSLASEASLRDTQESTVDKRFEPWSRQKGAETKLMSGENFSQPHYDLMQFLFSSPGDVLLADKFLEWLGEAVHKVLVSGEIQNTSSERWAAYIPGVHVYPENVSQEVPKSQNKVPPGKMFTLSLTATSGKKNNIVIWKLANKPIKPCPTCGDIFFSPPSLLGHQGDVQACGSDAAQTHRIQILGEVPIEYRGCAEAAMDKMKKRIALR